VANLAREEGQEMTEQKTSTGFRHYRAYHDNKQHMPHGGVTFYFEYTGTELEIATAICSLKDNYNKRLGRQITKGRFDDGQRASFTVHDMKEANERMFLIARDIWWNWHKGGVGAIFGR